MKLLKTSREGYIEIDHRDSPGMDMPGRRKGEHFKSSTMTCAKCQRIVILNPNRSRSRGYCRRCDRDVCDRCALLLKLNHECTLQTCYHMKFVIYATERTSYGT